MKFNRLEVALLVSAIFTAMGVAPSIAGDGQYDRTGSVVDLQLPDPPTRRAGNAADSVGPARSSYVFTNNDSVELPSHCSFDDTLPGCPNEAVEDDDGGDSGAIPAPPEVASTQVSCGFRLSEYKYGMTEAMTSEANVCRQGGSFRYSGSTRPPSLPNVAARFAALDDKGAPLKSDLYKFSWAGDCVGSEQSCISGYLRTSNVREVLSWRATATITEIATGAKSTHTSIMYWSVCGVVSDRFGSECF